MHQTFEESLKSFKKGETKSRLQASRCGPNNNNNINSSYIALKKNHMCAYVLGALNKSLQLKIVLN